VGFHKEDNGSRHLTGILAIFAHPDDEIGAGSTLAYYSDKGARTVLLCATRGEVATIFCDDCATRENLAQVRMGELKCACAHIGIRELRWLDWPDGGVKDLPRREAVGQIVRQIRDVRPDVIITHPEHGKSTRIPTTWQIWGKVRQAFSLAASASRVSKHGPRCLDAARLFKRFAAESFSRSHPV
jgi:LmbE family N-acetylglucosaminyl deacetylase